MNQPIRQQGKYSQNSEDVIIEKYFNGRTGTLLSLGENDGKTLSNVLNSIEQGWDAVLVEPSKTAFEKLKELHKERSGVICYNIAIGEQDGTADFYESGEHLGTGDTSLISTLKASEIDRWKGSKFDNFTKTETTVMTWQSFIGKWTEIYRWRVSCDGAYHQPVFNLISVDCEGLDYFIMKQMDLNALGCEMLIVEYNGIDELKYMALAAQYGLKLHEKNMENLIFVR